MGERSWEDLDIPDGWTATSMLRSMVTDHLGPNKAFDSGLDDVTRQRMVGVAIMSQLEVADKVAQLLRMFGELVASLDGDTEGG